MPQLHFLILSFPAQGHINPAIQFAKRLVRTGSHVTFVTSVSAHRRMTNTVTLDGLTYTSFSDGYDDGFKPGDNLLHYMAEIKRHGSQALMDISVAATNEHRPVTFIVYNFLLPWVADLARDLQVPSSLLWIQPASVLNIYYYYFNGYGDFVDKNISNPSFSMELPGLPLLTSKDLPSFFLPTNPQPHTLSLFKELIVTLEKETKARVLVNSFEALEGEALRAIDKFNMVAIGPLIPSAFLDGKDPSDTSFGGDMSFFSSRDYYMEWLNQKPDASVVYVSFGTTSRLSKKQVREIAGGLLESRRPFLWVLRPAPEENDKEEGDVVENMEELKQEGMVIPWCSQVEVLCHRSIGCFVTHCGWNSTLEGLVAGVPMVTFPQWSDQATNAKLIRDVWQTGLRLEVNEAQLVEGDELKRSIEIVMEGGRGEQMRGNAKRWKDLAREAVMDGGSSDKNLNAFVDDVRLLDSPVCGVERILDSASAKT
ncbi:phloretin 4'-O-glucosyltransferase-like [Telopea speciosissima]|uniref:phloretin 4'-O-glucosyltransferase-like n=1 Tax=Telopea speciosissima TaxID=54955 RepID=UPI001CC7FE34|nr:phloretin 4'-O-glucosyltransferase-like [Telopea speciosissima]